MNATRVTLDDEDVARVHQVALGLRPLDVLPRADVYLDTEGRIIAHRAGDGLRLTAPSPWPAPAAVRTDRPVVLAAPGQLPAGALPQPDAIVLLPTGGLRPDDSRQSSWITAWQALGPSVETPLTATDAAADPVAVAAAYSSGPLLDLPTTPLPTTAGRVVLLTGLSGSGKSTVARAVAVRLAQRRTVTLLDGDVVRTHLSRGLGFSREDRDVNIRRIGWVAAEIAKHGGIALCAPIAPYDETRAWVRRTVETVAGPGSFVLVWVATPLEVCEARDVKGLYARARSGELTGFTGIDDPYEVPHDADLVLDTSDIALETCVNRVLDILGESQR